MPLYLLFFAIGAAIVLELTDKRRVKHEPIDPNRSDGAGSGDIERKRADAEKLDERRSVNHAENLNKDELDNAGHSTGHDSNREPSSDATGNRETKRLKAVSKRMVRRVLNERKKAIHNGGHNNGSHVPVKPDSGLSPDADQAT